jgi:hypothetical protein
MSVKKEKSITERTVFIVEKALDLKHKDAGLSLNEAITKIKDAIKEAEKE